MKRLIWADSSISTPFYILVFKVYHYSQQFRNECFVTPIVKGSENIIVIDSFVDWPRLTDNFIMYQKKYYIFFYSKSVYLSKRAIWVWAKKGDYIREFFYPVAVLSFPWTQSLRPG